MHKLVNSKRTYLCLTLSNGCTQIRTLMYVGVWEMPSMIKLSLMPQKCSPGSFPIFFIVWAMPRQSVNILFWLMLKLLPTGLARVSLWYLLQSMSRQYTIPVSLLECGFGCFLRLRSPVFAGMSLKFLHLYLYIHSWCHFLKYLYFYMLLNFCRYMGTITGISDLDAVRWPNSHWRSVKVLTLL